MNGFNQNIEAFLDFNETAYIFCDGSFNAEDAKIGIGLVVLFSDVEMPAVYSYTENMPLSGNSKFVDGAAVAEFMAFTKGLEILWPKSQLILYSDNEMVVRRLSGKLDPKVKMRASTEVLSSFDQARTQKDFTFAQGSDKNTEDNLLVKYCMSLAHNAAVIGSGAGKLKKLPNPEIF